MKSLSKDDQTMYFAQIPILSLVKKYQTPLFLYDQDAIEERIHSLKEISKLNDHLTIYYASKAFLTLAMAHIIKENNLFIDVASRGELFIALKGGIDPTHVLFHGNNKTIPDIIYAIEQGVRKFVVDNLQELQFLKGYTNEKRITLEILIRVIPKIQDIKTHKNITTGHHQSKFGIDLDHWLDVMISILSEAKYVSFMGFHFHIGSQLMTNAYHLKAIDYVFKYIKILKDTHHIDVKELNLGGGFGIKYTEDDHPMTIQDFMEPIIKKIQSISNDMNLIHPHLSIEPGRYIVGGTALILYTVGIIKEGMPYPLVAINGGMTENLRVALYQAKYQAILIDRNENPCETYTIVGQACESTDLMIEKAHLPKLIAGDTIAFLNAGAYEHSLANNFNKTLKPAVVMIDKGKDRLIQEREVIEDLIKRDHV
ncbi:MAG: diaminopimelate decarboxylase [Acholeplasma sp.]|jgi:diaminopimelate decarboxylase|nr:MAG: diaminopimelate decarboxylase [Acholeplasma sp.]